RRLVRNSLAVEARDVLEQQGGVVCNHHSRRAVSTGKSRRISKDMDTLWNCLGERDPDRPGGLHKPGRPLVATNDAGVVNVSRLEGQVLTLSAVQRAQQNAVSR